jgi:hypothetical protein
MKRWMADCLAAASALTLLAGCASSATQGAEPAPVSVAPKTVAATPSVAPTPSATPFGSTADEAGAHAFVLAYYTEWERALTTGDTAGMLPYRLATCTCANFDRKIRTTYRAGGSFVGAQINVYKWVYGAHGPAFARTGIEFSVSKITDKVPGKKDHVEPAVYLRHFVDLRRVDNHWVISEIRYKVVSAP